MNNNLEMCALDIHMNRFELPDFVRVFGVIYEIDESEPLEFNERCIAVF
jgi:hypothetical protein